MKALNRRSCLIYVEKRTGRLHLNFKVLPNTPLAEQLEEVRGHIGMEYFQLPFDSLMITGIVSEVTHQQIILKNWTIQGGAHERV